MTEGHAPTLSTLERIQRALLTTIRSEWLLAFFVFAVNLILVSPDLTAIVPEISPYDEAQYIDSGRLLARGQLRGLDWSPLSAVLYAPIHLLVQESANWLAWLTTLGRIVLFGLLWSSFYSLGRSFSDHFPPLVFAGVLFVGTTFAEIVRNPSDALFASMSALALWQLMEYRSEYRESSIWLGSLFIGLAALSRNDGLFLIPLFIALILVIGRGAGSVLTHLMAAVIPAAALVGAYVLLLSFDTGSFTLGTGYRAYTTYTWSLENNLGLNSSQIAELVGPGDGTEPSIVRAVLGDPALFLQQVRHNLRGLPDAFLAAYGKRIGPPIFYLAILGGFVMARKGSWTQIAMLAIWTIPAFMYLGFYLRPGFILLYHYVLLILVAVAATWLVTDEQRAEARLLYVSPLIVLAIYGLFDAKPAFLVAGLIASLGFLVGWYFSYLYGTRLASAAVAFVILLTAGVVLRDGYSFPNYPRFGESSMERAISFLEENLPRGSRVYARVPLEWVAARMNPVDRGDIRAELESEVPLCEIIASHEIAAFYVPPNLIREESDLWRMLQGAEGTCVGTPVVFDPGSIQVILTQD